MSEMAGVFLICSVAMILNGDLHAAIILALASLCFMVWE